MRLLPALLLLLLATPAAAMSVETFLAKAEALKAKGMAALFSSDVGLLKREIVGAGQAWRGQVATARPTVCRPATGVKLNQDDVFAFLHAVPPAQRARVEVRDAMVAGLNERYRCR